MTHTLKICTSLFLLSLLASCNQVEVPDAKTSSSPEAWWHAVAPDIVIGPNEFYAGTCSITKVSTKTGASDLIFKVPKSPLTTCRNRDPALIYDDEYIILDVCEMTFGAGSCGGGRYRSKDYENWEEDIGITWIKGEAYEAWRKLGSTSSTADSVKKIIRD